MPAAPVIYINAYPGVGKLTIARGLQPLLPNSQILHNHDLIDPVEARYPRGSASYWPKRAEYRKARLKPIMHDPELRDTLFIFTDSKTEYNECVGDYTDLTLGEFGRRFYSVVLHCEAGENERRLVLPGRGEAAGNGKLVDVEVLRGYRGQAGILRFGDEDEVEIDVTGISAEEAAGRIRGFVERREREGRSSESWEEL